MNNNLAIRQAKQNCFCRVCDKEIQRNTEDIVSWYSWRNRGQNIHICIPCMKILGKLVEHHETVE